MTPRLPRRRAGAEPGCLLSRAADDASAFARFYELHAQPVLIFLAGRTMDVDVALDLMSETFAVALEKCDRFRGSTPEEEAGWLYAIARSQLSHYWRDGNVERRALQRLGLEPATLSAPEIEPIEQLAGLADVTTRLADALSDLPREQREAVELRIVGELDYAAVAGQLGISEQAARARVSRGLRALAGDPDLRAAKDLA